MGALPASQSHLPPRWLARVVTLLDERYNDPIRLEDLARAVQVHPVHISRSFRRCYGETLSAYVRRLRIDAARELLADGVRSIAEIALELGYHDESHFARSFKRVVGATPGRYRAIARLSGKLT